jgi:ubiquinone/menaquinone biosynthesis C-methylase UbiE
LSERWKEDEPYGALAWMYDELVGITAFECWRENFEHLVRRNEIGYETACDVACGTGLAAEYLSGRCGRVYAVDNSSEMLKVASSRCDEDKVTLIRQSFTELSLPETVDLLTCNFDSLNYLTDEDDLREALARFARALAQGGWAVFDMNTTAAFELDWDSAMFHRTSRGFSAWESSWDPCLRTATLRMTNFVRRPDGAFEMSEELHRERSYDPGLVLDALARGGFSAVEMFDANGLSEVSGATRRIQFAARL